MKSRIIWLVIIGNLICSIDTVNRHFYPWLCMCRHIKWYSNTSLLRSFNALRPRRNRRHFADIFKCLFLNENVWFLLKISLKFIPKVRINIIPALVHIMAWCRPGGKPLSEPMMVSLLTDLCVTEHPLLAPTDHGCRYAWNIIGY